jgi:hypothetical protein
MNPDELRKLANALLMDPRGHGISGQAWGLLREQLIQAGIYDEYRWHVDATDDYFYIDPNYPI